MELRCIDPVFKLCQYCKCGWVKYQDDVGSYQDTFGATFETGCMYGLENDAPTDEELKEAEEWLNKTYKNGKKED